MPTDGTQYQGPTSNHCRHSSIYLFAEVTRNSDKPLEATVGVHGLTGVALGRYCPQLNTNTMPRFLEVVQGVPISIQSLPPKLLAPAAKRTTGQTKPEIFPQFAFCAMREACGKIGIQSQVDGNIAEDVPEAEIWPLDICWSVRVCSQGSISSSQA
jgi:hypothetical protein